MAFFDHKANVITVVRLAANDPYIPPERPRPRTMSAHEQQLVNSAD